MSSINRFKSYTNNNDFSLVKKKEFKIKEDEFPGLSGPIKKTDNNNQSFINSLKKEIIVETKEIEIEKTPVGWVSYSFNKKTKSNVFTIVNREIIKNKIELIEEEEIINGLTRLHEKRTKKYKESWGEDEHNQMFNFPNYDYEYFDRLDEAYENEQLKLYEQYNNYNNEYYEEDNNNYD